MSNVSNFKRLLFLASCVLLVASYSACARKPTQKSTEHIIKSYFHKYGHKFKDTDFGKHDVEYVSVMDIEEVHKYLVSAKAQVKLKDGPSFLVRCNLNKRSTGWRVESWENMQ